MNWILESLLSALLSWPPVTGGLLGLMVGLWLLGGNGALFGLILGVAGGVLIYRRRLRQIASDAANRDATVSMLARGARRNRGP